MQWLYVAVGMILMLVDSFFDNVRGPLLPELSRVFSLNYGEASSFFVLGNLASAIGTLFLIPLTQKYSEKKVSEGVCFFALAVALFAFGVQSRMTLWIFAVVLGLVVAISGGGQ